MKYEIMEYEAIKAHVEENFSLIEDDVTSLTEETALVKLCNVYKVVRPLLVAMANFFFWSKKIKRAIKKLISIMDYLCPKPAVINSK